MRKTFLFILLTTVMGLSSFAQLNLEAYGSYVRNFNPDFKNTTKGGGLRLEFGKEDAALTKFVGIAYNLPMYSLAPIEAQAFSNRTEPSWYPVTARYKQPMMRAEFGGRWYITGEAENFEGINWYAQGSVEVIFIRNKPEYSYYDKELYSLGYSPDSDVNEDGTSKFDANFYLAVGTGIEKNLGIGNVFLQAAFAFPAFSPNASGSANIENFAPIPLNINLGYKVPLRKN